MKVFLSDRIGSEKNAIDGKPALVFGAANYSWKIVSNLYSSALKLVGNDIREIVRPEIFQTETARNLIDCAASDIHLAVKPIEHLRFMAGVRNFYVCGWEFPQFSISNNNVSPFLNQIKVLSSAEKILCWSNYTATNLKQHGLQANSVPPPVLAGLPHLVDISIFEKLRYVRLNSTGKGKDLAFCDHAHLSELKNEGARVFLTVLNPFDLRKDLPNMLNGFTKFTREGGDAILVVKLVIDNNHTTVRNINEILRSHYKINLLNDKIFFAGDALSSSELFALYQWTDFYICTSSAEGLNLPLIEAITAGAFPVSTFNSAMLDYLDDSSAIEISCERRKFYGQGHALAGYLDVDHFPTSSASVTTALQTAYSLSLETRISMAACAQKNISGKYSLSAFKNNWGALVG